MYLRQQVARRIMKDDTVVNEEKKLYEDKTSKIIRPKIE